MILLLSFLYFKGNQKSSHASWSLDSTANFFTATLVAFFVVLPVVHVVDTVFLESIAKLFDVASRGLDNIVLTSCGAGDEKLVMLCAVGVGGSGKSSSKSTSMSHASVVPLLLSSFIAILMESLLSVLYEEFLGRDKTSDFKGPSLVLAVSLPNRSRDGVEIPVDSPAVIVALSSDLEIPSTAQSVQDDAVLEDWLSADFPIDAIESVGSLD